jgi:hypothetical protein
MMKGQVLIFIITFGFLMILPLILGTIFPEIGWLIQLYLALTIYLFVKNILGDGIPTWVISLILIYILVIRLYPLFAAGYVLYLVASLGLSGIIFFGLQGVDVAKMAKRR